MAAWPVPDCEKAGYTGALRDKAANLAVAMLRLAMGPLTGIALRLLWGPMPGMEERAGVGVIVLTMPPPGCRHNGTPGLSAGG